MSLALLMNVFLEHVPKSRIAGFEELEYIKIKALIKISYEGIITL